MTEEPQSERAADPTPDAGAGAVPEPDPSVVARRRLRRAFTRRPGRGQYLAAALCAMLGFAVVLQVQTVRSDEVLATARPEDLVQLLDSLDQRSARLDAEAEDLTAVRDRLRSGRDAEEAAAQEQARREADLGILAGTVAATGPGIEVAFSGPVSASLLLDTVQELRDAGAEAIQIDDVRVVAQTAFVPRAGGGALVDGTAVDGRTRPVVLRAIGDPATLDTSLRIPGGVVDTAASDDVTVRIQRSDRLVIDALRPLPTPDYAAPKS